MSSHFASVSDAHRAYRESGSAMSFLRWADANGVTWRTV